MSISQERITHACNSCAGVSGAMAAWILEADDAYRATHQPAAPGRDEEPYLPGHIRFDEANNCYRHYAIHDAVPGGFLGRDLRKIADYQDWRDRQRTREQGAPMVTDAMVGAACKAYDSISKVVNLGAMQAAIKAALAEAQRSEARKQV